MHGPEDGNGLMRQEGLPDGWPDWFYSGLWAGQMLLNAENLVQDVPGGSSHTCGNTQ